MEYVTISKWCQNWLREEYHTEAAYLPNGIDPSFYPKRGRDLQGKIRILIEGDCSAEHKNVDESFRIVEQLDLEKFEIWYMSYNGNPKSWYRVDRFLHRVPSVSYTHLDVYKRQDQIWARKMIELGFKKVYCPYAPVYHSCLLYTSRCV